MNRKASFSPTLLRSSRACGKVLPTVLMIGLFCSIVRSAVSAARCFRSSFRVLRSMLLPEPLSPVMWMMSVGVILSLRLSYIVNFCCWSVPSPKASATWSVRGVFCVAVW